ncbi:MAG: hypothetical protein KJZ64_05550 [Sphingomonadaceae bacterium]|nr:hypothetical protein [Sphingomonadaceae bacterium]
MSSELPSWALLIDGRPIAALSEPEQDFPWFEATISGARPDTLAWLARLTEYMDGCAALESLPDHQYNTASDALQDTLGITDQDLARFNSKLTVRDQQGQTWLARPAYLRGNSLVWRPVPITPNY